MFQKGATMPKLPNVITINASPELVWGFEVLDVSQEADVIQIVDGASKQTLASLRQCIEEAFLS